MPRAPRPWRFPRRRREFEEQNHISRHVPIPRMVLVCYGYGRDGDTLYYCTETPLRTYTRISRGIGHYNRGGFDAGGNQEPARVVSDDEDDVRDDDSVGSEAEGVVRELELSDSPTTDEGYFRVEPTGLDALETAIDLTEPVRQGDLVELPLERQPDTQAGARILGALTEAGQSP